MIQVTAAPSATIPWFTMVMGLLLLAFIMYIVAKGSISRYKSLLFGA